MKAIKSEYIFYSSTKLPLTFFFFRESFLYQISCQNWFLVLTRTIIIFIFKKILNRYCLKSGCTRLPNHNLDPIVLATVSSEPPTVMSTGNPPRSCSTVTGRYWMQRLEHAITFWTLYNVVYNCGKNHVLSWRSASHNQLFLYQLISAYISSANRYETVQIGQSLLWP